MKKDLWKEDNVPDTSPLPIQNKIIFNKMFLFPFMLRGKVRNLEIRKNFISDGGSIPRPLWPILMSPFAPKGCIPYGFHDIIFLDGGVWVHENGRRFFMALKQKEADQLLEQMLKYFQVGKYTRSVVYRGLRIGGWVKWNQYRKKDRM